MKSLSLNDNNFLAELKKASTEKNFVVLKDTGINLELIKPFYADWEQFFLSEQKYKYQYDRQHQVGYYPLSTEIAKNGKVPDYKECFHYYPLSDRCPQDRLKLTNQLYGQFLALSKVFASCLQQIMPKSLQEKIPEELRDCIDQQWRTLLRVLHYPAPHAGIDTQAPRAIAHEDICLFTLMPYATAAGLEIKNKQGGWESVVIQPDEMLLMFGEMLETYTQGFFSAATHRVSFTETNKRMMRMASAFFVHPRPDVKITQNQTADELFYQRMQEINLL